MSDRSEVKLSFGQVFSSEFAVTILDYRILSHIWGYCAYCTSGVFLNGFIKLVILH